MVIRVLSLAAAFAVGMAAALWAAWGLQRSPPAPLATADVEQIVATYLRENPDAVIDSIRAYQARVEQDKKSEQREITRAHWDEIARQGDDPVLGNPQGDVTLVEFFDYRCGYCRRAFADVMALKQADPQLRIVIKEFPILGPESIFASQAALAANRQGKYAAFHEAMMESPGQIDEVRVFEVAEAIGLDIDQLRRDMDSPEVKAILQRNFTLAEELGLRGTPVFVTRNEIIPGAAGLEALKALVASARKSSS